MSKEREIKFRIRLLFDKASDSISRKHREDNSESDKNLPKNNAATHKILLKMNHKAKVVTDLAL